MAISTSRKVSGTVLTLVLLAGTILSFLPAMVASHQIHQFCESLALGTSFAEMQARSADLGYSVERIRAGLWRVEHPRSLGRAYCDVGFDAVGYVSTKNDDN